MKKRSGWSKSSVTAQTRVDENPGKFRVVNDILLDWARKSTVDDHLK
ncbi:4476_t:CDS:1, partial [Gigaspora rosea]